MNKQLIDQAIEALEAMQRYAADEKKGLRICDEAIAALRAERDRVVADPMPAVRSAQAAFESSVRCGNLYEYDSYVAGYEQGQYDESMYQGPPAQPASEPDQYCVTAPDGSCVSTDPKCMHQVRPEEPIAYLWKNRGTGKTLIVLPDQVWTSSPSWTCEGPLVLGAPAPLGPNCWVVIKDGQIIATHDEPCHYLGIKAVRYVPAGDPK
jgi:hypothetical protein